MNNFFSRLFLTVIAIACLTVVSCSDNDDNTPSEEPSIMGVWVSEPRPIYYNDAPIPNTEAVAYMWYKEGGAFVEADVITDTKNNETSIELSENGRWSIENDVVTQTTNFDEKSSDEFDTEVLKFKISGNTLYMTYTDDGEDITVQLQRTNVERMQEIIAAAKTNL
jgi:hypothetical protein